MVGLNPILKQDSVWFWSKLVKQSSNHTHCYTNTHTYSKQSKKKKRTVKESGHSKMKDHLQHACTHNHIHTFGRSFVSSYSRSCFSSFCRRKKGRWKAKEKMVELFCVEWKSMSKYLEWVLTHSPQVKFDPVDLWSKIFQPWPSYLLFRHCLSRTTLMWPSLLL